MIRNTMHAIRDLWSYASMGWNRSRFGRKHRGKDYTAACFSELAEKTAGRIHPRTMRLQVTEIIMETPSTRTFRFERSDGPSPPFSAGQYVNVFQQIGKVHTSRPYSISSAPGEPFLDLTVRLKTDGFVSGHLFDGLEVGDEVTTTGPSGWFCHEPLIDGEDLVFLAGGSGITPFMGMLRDFSKRGVRCKVHLLYGSRTPEDVIFRDGLEKMQEAMPDLSVTHVISDPPEGYQGISGFLDADCIRKVVGDVAGRRFYVCGPNRMLDLCRSALEELGVGLHRIRTELYGPPEDVTRIAGWPEKIDASSRFSLQVDGVAPFDVRAGEPLINSLERNGLVVPAVCRSGECSACRMKVISGEVFIPPGVGIRESDRSHGYVHACMAYPVTNLHIRL